MERRTFLSKMFPEKKEWILGELAVLRPRIIASAERQGVHNFSMWTVGDLLCGYGEYEGDFDLDKDPEMKAEMERVLDGTAELLCPTGSMRLMYHDIGVVRADTSLIRHRVFVTKLKPGCAEEYKRRHDALIEARGDTVSDGPDSNFTIWYGAGYIFGYCEKVKSFDREMTEQERADTIAWETRQLEIMDWLTDDVDWITGETHEKIRRVV